MLVGLTLGVTMGITGFIIGYMKGGLDIAIIIGFTMLAIILVANLIGVALPFILTRMGLDPAVASSPLIASIVDATGLFIYFIVAVSVLQL
jgi:magnesium transporter